MTQEIQDRAVEQNWQGDLQFWHWLLESKYIPSGHVLMHWLLNKTLLVIQLVQLVTLTEQVAHGDMQAVHICDSDI